MGPTWVLSAPDGPHVGPMNLAIGVFSPRLGRSDIRCFSIHPNFAMRIDIAATSHTTLHWQLHTNRKYILENSAVRSFCTTNDGDCFLFVFYSQVLRMYPKKSLYMMTSSNGTIFRVTGPLCGDSPVPVNSPHKGQWRGALMFSLILAWINDWVNNREAGDLGRHCRHYDVIVMTK